MAQEELSRKIKLEGESPLAKTNGFRDGFSRTRWEVCSFRGLGINRKNNGQTGGTGTLEIDGRGLSCWERKGSHLICFASESRVEKARLLEAFEAPFLIRSE